MYRESIIYFYSFILSVSLLFPSYLEIDKFQEQSMFDEALELCKQNFNDNDVEILWRMARSYFDIADQTSDEEVQKILIKQDNK